MPPSSNWLTLKRNLKRSSRHENDRPTKRLKVDNSSERASDGSVAAAVPRITTQSKEHALPANRDSVDFLRRMVHGQVEYPPAHLLPGRYLAIDCEMVGIAGDPKDPSVPGKRNQGDESSLARVSVVNYHGAVQLDVFVKQRERVTDWRTAFSGVRESDMVNAKPFLEVQKLVSDLLKDRILVGHAVHNDLKVLLLSHPYNMTRDTQALAGLHGTLTSSKTRPATAATSAVRGNRRPALRKLVSQELGIEIQTGEHSSIIDARATMAIYRLHRKTWDRRFKVIASAQEQEQSKTQSDADIADDNMPLGGTDRKIPTVRKRSRGALMASTHDDTDGAAGPSNGAHVRRPKKKFLPGDRKGLSSGLSVVVKRRQGGAETKRVLAGTRGGGIEKTTKWWGTLG